MSRKLMIAALVLLACSDEHPSSVDVPPLPPALSQQEAELVNTALDDVVHRIIPSMASPPEDLLASLYQLQQSLPTADTQTLVAHVARARDIAAAINIDTVEAAGIEMLLDRIEALARSQLELQAPEVGGQ